MTSSYEDAGLTAVEIEHLSSLVSNALSSDPSIPWIAVRRTDVLVVVATLDRIVDQVATTTDATGRHERSASTGGSDRGDDAS